VTARGALAFRRAPVCGSATSTTGHPSLPLRPTSPPTAPRGPTTPRRPLRGHRPRRRAVAGGSRRYRNPANAGDDGGGGHAWPSFTAPARSFSPSTLARWPRFGDTDRPAIGPPSSHLRAPADVGDHQPGLRDPARKPAAATRPRGLRTALTSIKAGPGSLRDTDPWPSHDDRATVAAAVEEPTARLTALVATRPHQPSRCRGVLPARC
jgi:hypothetical protein